MKYTKIIFFLLIIAIAISGESCKKSFLVGLNQNPNTLNKVSPNVLLPTVEIALGYTQGNLERFTSLITQQTFGEASEPAAYYTYGYNPGTFESVWGNYYTSVLENNYALMSVSDAAGDNTYSGISRILMAYTLQTMVDAWGKIPYSQALRGAQNGIVQPVYDNDRVLYDTIASLVTVGIADLNNPATGVAPGTDDAMYGGDATKWIKFGHAIKARLYIHQSKDSGITMAIKALTEINASFTGTVDNAQYIFPAVQAAANPWYQFGRDEAGQITFANTTIAAQLLTFNDPRYSKYIDSTNDGRGMDSTNTYWGGLAAYYGSVNSPVEFITFDELLFASAEATLRATGNIAATQVLYDSAIVTDMKKVGVADSLITPYIAAHGILNSNTDSAIAQIAVQEYLALYLSPEAWVVWRRTNSPALTPTFGTTIPRRLEYPQSELDFNTNKTPAVTLFTPKIFWDN